jgi:hypothetical protein
LSVAAAALPPSQPQQQQPLHRLKPLLISHVSNFARHGDTDAQQWGEMLRAERAQLAATLATVREREEKLRAIRGGAPRDEGGGGK